MVKDADGMGSDEIGRAKQFTEMNRKHVARGKNAVLKTNTVGTAFVDKKTTRRSQIPRQMDADGTGKKCSSSCTNCRILVERARPYVQMDRDTFLPHFCCGGGGMQSEDG